MDPFAGHDFGARIHFRQCISALLFIIAVACGLSAKRRADHVMQSDCDQHTLTPCIGTTSGCRSRYICALKNTDAELYQQILQSPIIAYALLGDD